MPLIIKPFTYMNGSVADANEVNANFDVLFNLLNGNLDGENLANNSIPGSDLIDDSVGFDKLDWGSGENQIDGTETPYWLLSKGSDFEFRMEHEGLSDTRVWSWPDTDDRFVGEDTEQSIRNKIFEDDLLFRSDTNHIARFDHDNTDERVYRLPDQSGHLPSLPSEAITETGSGAIVRSQNPTIDRPIINRPIIEDLADIPGVAPVGSIIPFYDYNFNLSFNPDYWKYCDGSDHDFGPGIGVQQLPDLSGRYLVGFGADGEENLDSALWDFNAVGHPNHQIDLSHNHNVEAHNHTVNGHSHRVDAHNHGIGEHRHGPGSLKFNVFQVDNIDNRVKATTSGGNFEIALGNGSFDATYSGNGGAVNYTDSPNSSGPGFIGRVVDYVTYNSQGQTSESAGDTSHASPSTNSVNLRTNNTSPNTDHALSVPRSIQPRSVRVRYLMRVR